MFSAIEQNRPEFVRAMIEHGFVLSKFVSYRVLIALYNSDELKKESLFHKLFLDTQKRSVRSKDPADVYIKLSDVGLIIESLLNGFYDHEYSKHPFNALTEKDIRRIVNQTVGNFNICTHLS
jgi:hypothetical protein